MKALGILKPYLRVRREAGEQLTAVVCTTDT